MAEMNIIDVHKECLNFLTDWQKEHADFFFVPRRRNNKNRLEQGMYFLGNEDYMVLTFWDSEDSKEFIYHINWCCYKDGSTSIVLNCRDNEQKLPYILALKEILESKIGKFEKIKNNKWEYSYQDTPYYLDTLREFIQTAKPLIDDYLRQHPESNIPLADKEIHDKYVLKLPGYKAYVDSIPKDKKTGSVKVKASEYMMTFQHNELSNAMVEYLKNNGYKNVKAEDNYVDISCMNPDGEIVFFELKTAQTVKYAIREAIGQLLEYRHYPDERKADKLIIVTESKPNEKDVQYLKELRLTYNLPVYYQQFDMKDKNLSQDY